MTPFEALDLSIQQARRTLRLGKLSGRIIYEFDTDQWHAIISSAPSYIQHDAFTAYRFVWHGVTCREGPRLFKEPQI